MLVKKILFIFFCIMVVNCSGFEFVYKSAPDALAIKNKTSLVASGDDSEILNNYFISKIGYPNNIAEFQIFAHSTKKIDASVLEKDATASKFTISYLVNYRFENTKENCSIYSTSITNQGSYDSKSAGYSFGTDLSEKEVSEKIIQSNINQFLNSVNSSAINLNCKNEN